METGYVFKCFKFEKKKNSYVKFMEITYREFLNSLTLSAKGHQDSCDVCMPTRRGGHCVALAQRPLVRDWFGGVLRFELLI